MKLKVEIRKQELEQKPWGNAASLFAFHGLLSPFSYRTQGHLPRGDTTTGAGPLVSVISKQNAQQPLMQINLTESLFNCCFLFSDNSTQYNTDSDHNKIRENPTRITLKNNKKQTTIMVSVKQFARLMQATMLLRVCGVTSHPVQKNLLQSCNPGHQGLASSLFSFTISPRF